MDPFLGQLMLVPYNFAPRGWAFCNGQTLPIAQNTALFALIGTTFGGNGQTTFQLPNLQGRFPMHWGSANYGDFYTLGESWGSPTHTLLVTEMPMHNHLVNASSAVGASSGPSGGFVAAASVDDPTRYGTTNVDATLHPQSIALAGGSQPFSIMPPFLAMSWVIALEGIFPSRN